MSQQSKGCDVDLFFIEVGIFLVILFGTVGHPSAGRTDFRGLRVCRVLDHSEAGDGAMGLRVSEEEEQVGVDLSQHDEKAYS
jgi:hypothetical protein